MTKLFNYLFWVSATVLVLSFIQKDKLPDRSEIRDELYREPLQLAVEKSPITVEKAGMAYIIRPLYSYDIYGMVVSYHHSVSFDDYYHKQWKDVINTKDICVIWGENIKSGVYQKMTFESGSWTCYTAFKPNVSRAEWNKYKNECLSNNHLIPANEGIGKVIMALRKGDQVHIKGYLVNYREAKWSGERTTSTTRTDTGNGACEVIWVQEVKILQRANMGWHFLFNLSIISCLITLGGLAFAWYRDSKQLSETLKRDLDG